MSKRDSTGRYRDDRKQSTGKPRQTATFIDRRDQEDKSSVKRFSSNLIDMLKSAKETKGSKNNGIQYYKQDVFESQNQETSSQHGRPAYLSEPQPHQEMYTDVDTQEADFEISNLIEEALKVYHIPKDLSHIPKLKSVLDQKDANSSQASGRNTDNSTTRATMNEIKIKVQQHERNRYEQAFKNNLIALLRLLEVPNSETFIERHPSMEEIAYEIKQRLTQGLRSVSASARLVKKESMILQEDNEEMHRENKRLKELVVKLQYEINENFKKGTDQRVRELFEDNQNQQRKIADLIDQLKRKEQEILLIPVGRVAQGKIEALEIERNEIQKQFEELRRKYIEEVEELKGLLSTYQKTEFMPTLVPEIHVDLQMLQTLKEQRRMIEELSELVTNLREENVSLVKNIKELEKAKLEFQKISTLLENYLSSEGVDPDELISRLNTNPDLSDPPGPDSETIKELREIQSHLQKFKEEVNKSTLGGQ